MTEPKICTNCRWHRVGGVFSGHSCAHKDADQSELDVVTGFRLGSRETSCIDMRGDQYNFVRAKGRSPKTFGNCGSSGRLYEERDNDK